MAPNFFNKQQIGETLATEDSQVQNRTITSNLMVLTKDIKKQNINVTFKINKVQGDTAFTSIVRYEMLPSSVRRLVRKNTDKIVPSFACYTSDNVRVRAKMFVLTRSLTKSSVHQSLTKMTTQMVTTAIKKLPIENLFTEILTSRFQRKLLADLRKVYPIKFCEVRVLEIEPLNKKAKVIEVSEEDLKAADEAEAKKEAAKKEKMAEREAARAQKAKEAAEAKEEASVEEKEEVSEEVKEDESSSN